MVKTLDKITNVALMPIHLHDALIYVDSCRGKRPHRPMIAELLWALMFPYITTYKLIVILPAYFVMKWGDNNGQDQR